MKKDFKKDFPVLSISRENLDELGFKAKNLSDEDMEYIASKFADNAFQDLEYVVESLDIPKKRRSSN